MAAKFEDSNIALLGSEVEKNVKLAAAQCEAEWRGAGTKAGIEIWRVESFKIKRWPREQYGSFFGGDSYIILNSYQHPEQPEKLLYNVHFWLGGKTTQDEAGTAAYKTVELDDLLGDLPVQYREVQGYESQEFLDLFKDGITVMAGGAKSGFRHVKPEEYQPRLMQVKGKRKNVRVDEVKLSVDSLNMGDVFILDCGLQLFRWDGTSANVHEKREAQRIIQNIREQRNGKPRAEIIDGMDEHEVFWTVLGGKKQVKEASAGGDDEKAQAYTKKMLKLSDASGALTMTEVASGTISKSHLDSNDVFIVDIGSMVYVWVGKGASKNERSSAFKYANEYLVKARLPFTTPVVRVVEGSINRSFEAVFGAGFAKPKGWKK